jgi:hypothetical protein
VHVALHAEALAERSGLRCRRTEPGAAALVALRHTAGPSVRASFQEVGR